MKRRETVIYHCEYCGFESEDMDIVTQCELTHVPEEAQKKEWIAKASIVRISEAPAGIIRIGAVYYNHLYPKRIKVQHADNGFAPALYVLDNAHIPSICVNTVKDKEI